MTHALQTEINEPMEIMFSHQGHIREREFALSLSVAKIMDNLAIKLKFTCGQGSEYYSTISQQSWHVHFSNQTVGMH